MLKKTIWNNAISLLCFQIIFEYIFHQTIIFSDERMMCDFGFNIWIIPKMKEYLYNITSQIFVDTINHTPEWRSSHEINSIPISSDQWFLKLFVMFTIIGKYNSYNSWHDKIKRNILLIASYALYSVMLHWSRDEDCSICQKTFWCLTKLIIRFQLDLGTLVVQKQNLFL